MDYALPERITRPSKVATTSRDLQLETKELTLKTINIRSERLGEDGGKSRAYA